jgi:hypothetical protein
MSARVERVRVPSAARRTRRAVRRVPSHLYGPLKRRGALLRVACLGPVGGSA